MTPAARVAAAIEILESMMSGLAAEQALTRWARNSRFAGSKDRAAIRDHVFDALRIRQTAAHLGGSENPRGLMIGVLVWNGENPKAYFTGEGHAPSCLSVAESAAIEVASKDPAFLDIPEWLEPEFQRSLGQQSPDIARMLRSRAPITLRTNIKKTDRVKAARILAEEGIETEINPLSETALTVIQGARGIRQSKAFAGGLIELQDAASQAVVDLVPFGSRCLDFCAGGGGKALALAAQDGRKVWAHDADARRMQDIPARAARAGCQITEIAGDALTGSAPFDVVLCDVPCSGSGAWRRAPEGKWRLTQARLDALCQTQTDILVHAAGLVRPGGWLVLATCSVLRCENEDRISAFLSHNPGWRCTLMKRFDVSKHGDGFFTAHLTQV